jgi:hypothetical protein
VRGVRACARVGSETVESPAEGRRRSALGAGRRRRYWRVGVMHMQPLEVDGAVGRQGGCSLSSCS